MIHILAADVCQSATLDCSIKKKAKALKISATFVPSWTAYPKIDMWSAKATKVTILGIWNYEYKYIYKLTLGIRTSHWFHIHFGCFKFPLLVARCGRHGWKHDQWDPSGVTCGICPPIHPGNQSMDFYMRREFSLPCLIVRGTSFKLKTQVISTLIIHSNTCQGKGCRTWSETWGILYQGSWRSDGLLQKPSLLRLLRVFPYC